MPTDEVAWALGALRNEARLSGYRAARRYYDGDHQLAFATEKYRDVFGAQFGAITDNLCPAVVDSVSDRLKITGVTGADQTIADAGWAIWQRNRMDVRAPETHHDALLTGDGYALVWPNKANEAVIWSISSSQMAVDYDPNRPGWIRRAARLWRDDLEQQWHLDLYTPDRIARYVRKASSRSTIIAPASYRPRDFEPYVPTEVNAAGGEDNPYGRVPVVHFPNRRYHCYGISELADVIPLQDALNKALSDMMIAMEFSAFAQRWATGIDVGEVDESGKPVSPPFDYGVDRILTAGGVDAKFGDFRTTDLTQYVEVQENLRSEIARVSGTPLHYLFITRGDFPSGEAMKSAEARFTRKVENRQASFGNQWEDLLRLALVIEGQAEPAEGELAVEWESAEPTIAGAAVGALRPEPPTPPPA